MKAYFKIRGRYIYIQSLLFREVSGFSSLWFMFEKAMEFFNCTSPTKPGWAVTVVLPNKWVKKEFKGREFSWYPKLPAEYWTTMSPAQIELENRGAKELLMAAYFSVKARR